MRETENATLAVEQVEAVSGGNEAGYQAGLQIGQTFGNLYQGAVNATTDAMCAVHNFFTGDQL